MCGLQSIRRIPWKNMLLPELGRGVIEPFQLENSRPVLDLLPRWNVTLMAHVKVYEQR